ncbi:MAG: helix-turn-helix transcriptional regulator [Rickettsiales bacterium]|nr:helix-turn-helix transcriptional regulator [Rickettsiales bacterium]
MVTTPIDKRIGSKLKARRNYLGITQSSLGSMLGVTFQQVQKYEKGINKISVSRLKELSRILRVSVEYFLSDSDAIIEALGDPELEGKSSENSRIGATIPGQENDRDGTMISEKELVTLIKYFRKIESKKVRSDTLNLVRSFAMGGKTRRRATT